MCMMKSAPVVRCVSPRLQWHSQGHTLEVWVALVGILWILYEVLLVVPAGLMRLLSGSQWSCWSNEISQWEPACLSSCTTYCSVTQVYMVCGRSLTGQPDMNLGCVGVLVCMCVCVCVCVCVSRKYWCVWSVCTCANTFMHTTHPPPCTVCNVALL